MPQSPRFRPRGVFVFVMTPFLSERDRRGRFLVDLEGLERNCSHFAGIAGDRSLVLCGGSGEFFSLSPSEVADVSAAAVSGVGRRSCQVICGIGGTARTVVRMAEAAQECGCSAVLMMPHDPTVRKGERAILDRHRRVSRAIDIGLIPFRAPKQLLSTEAVVSLTRLRNVVAVKEESGAVDWVRSGLRLTEGRTSFITGGGENMVPYYYLAGAVGFTTGMANITLERSIALHRAARRKDWGLAMKLRDWFEPLTELRKELGTPMLKAGLEMQGLAGGPVRDTGAVLDRAQRRRVMRLLRIKELLDD